MSDVRKLLHPDFFVAGRKPTGDVEIDWSNPLARGLTHAYLLNESAGAAINLVSGDRSNTVGLTRVIAKGQKVTRHDGSGDYIVCDDVDVTDKFSAYVFASHDVENQSRHLVSRHPGWFLAGNTSPAGMRFSINTGTETSVVIEAWSNLDLDALYGYGATYDGATVETYLDGAGKNSVAKTGNINNTGETRIGAYWNNPTSTSFSWDGDISIVLLWDRAISAAEHSLVHANPYQILKPKTNYFYVPEVAAVGITGTSTTTNAADTQASTGELTNSGTSTTTNAADTQTASGALTNSGTAATTNVPDAQAAAGELTNSGTAVATNAPDTQAAAGILTVAGTSATTNADDIHAASGTVSAITAITGTSATTNAPDIHSALGFVGVDITPPTTAGLEFEVGSNRLHFEASSNKLDYSVEYNRLHYEVTE